MPATAWALAALLAAPAQERVIRVTAKRFEFSPSVIELRVGEPVVLELTSLDRRHGFAVPLLKIDEKIEPGKTLRLRVVPDRPGTWDFHCNLFCGSGHEDMEGRIVVLP
ncbi:MAG TPA: cupredoxin domain-containing protein [Myxococcales bacterium]|nr:cupredoxin domain-containing protein [Myxococcales bacterium]